MANEAQIAAKWWADKLCAKKLAGRDYARPGEISADAQMIALMTSKRPDFPDAQVESFELALQIKIAAEIVVAQHGRDDFHFSLGVDYHPDYMLQLAAQDAGIKTLDGFLSWKTRMWISNGEVKVREGYGAPMVYLLGFEKAELEWIGRRVLWVEDINGDRTETLKDYPQFADLPPEESFEQLVRRPIKYEE